MMTSYVNAVKFQGHQNLNRKIPSIFQIQDFIESAWDAGINTQGRLETGGIKGTRKYIGTPEVCWCHQCSALE
jgi:zinc finger-containing ubiquitin peptidase 1